MVDRGLAANDSKPTLYEVLMQLGPPVDDPLMTQEAFAARRKEMDQRFQKRLDYLAARRREDFA